MSQTGWIAVDWGTSNLRLWAIGDDGSVLADRQSDKGMGRLNPDEFEAAFVELADDLVGERSCDVVISGMAGARQGWIEAAYSQIPCGPLSAKMTRPNVSDQRLRVHILPGLCQSNPPDVMRGEETQIAGFIADKPAFDGTICLPGTHSKWVEVRQGRVEGFQTFMTGELFDLLSKQSILRHSVDSSQWDDAAFLEGVGEVFQSPHKLAASLFPVRAASLLSAANPAVSRARLSGMLIGSELAAIRNDWHGQEVVLIGAQTLCGLYDTALQSLGCKTRIEDCDAMTLAGLRAAYQLLSTEREK